jgi:hypothetical protein
VVRVLHALLFYPFHVQHFEILQPPLDYEHRKAFCERLLQRDATVPSPVLLMDEARFIRNGILVTSTHGLIKIRIPLKKIDFKSSCQQIFGRE